MKKQKQLTVNIKGHDWLVVGMTSSAYVRKHGNDSGAIMNFQERKMFFNLSSVTPYYVRHEVLHAFVSSSSTASARLTVDQIEELCADLYGEHGPEMDVIADKILSTLLG